MTKVQKPMTKEIPTTQLPSDPHGGPVGHSSLGAFLGPWSLVIDPSFIIRHSDFVTATLRTVSPHDFH